MYSPELLAYNASKHALIGWIRSFTMLPAVCNVRINAVCPHVMCKYVFDLLE